MRARYSRWDATQDPLGGSLDVGEVLDELSDELLEGAGADHALDALRRRGLAGTAGLDTLRRRLRALRRRALEDVDPSGAHARVAAELERILDLERVELSLRDADSPREQEAMLAALPDGLGSRLAELTHYPFTSPEARARFERLVEELRREMLDATFRSLSSALRGLDASGVERVKDMLAELNGMLEARARGDAYDFEGFMQRHGDLFPDRPRTLDDLVAGFARRMAAMSRLVAQLTAEQRAELDGLSSAVLDDLGLELEIQRLREALRQLATELAWGEPAGASLGGDLPLAAAVDAVERVSELEDLERTLEGDYPGASLDDVDEDALRRSLGDDAVRDLRTLKSIERALESAGVAQRTAGRLELTARGARLLGERSLTRLLARVRREPTHRGRAGHAEETGQTRPWSFGDSEPLSVQRTVFNAVTRRGPHGALPLTAEDFEVCETEARPRTATALLLDLSFSMPLGGHWLYAKKMALALHALIDGKYPHDDLFIVGFSDYARVMEPVDLACAGWEHVHGTNMQHAFLLAGRLLARTPAPVRQVIMVTDGEPTAHLDKHGNAFFHWPPVPTTIEKTLREAARLARSGTSINVYMLEETPGLVRFMDKLARLTGGEVIPAAASELGDAIVGSYARRRRR